MSAELVLFKVFVDVLLVIEASTMLVFDDRGWIMTEDDVAVEFEVKIRFRMMSALCDYQTWIRSTDYTSKASPLLSERTNISIYGSTAQPLFSFAHKLSEFYRPPHLLEIKQHLTLYEICQIQMLLQQVRHLMRSLCINVQTQGGSSRGIDFIFSVSCDRYAFWWWNNNPSKAQNLKYWLC